MPDPAFALGGARHDGHVRVTELRPRGMLLIKGPLGSEALAGAVEAATGMDVPGPLGAVRGGEAALLWMAPDELLLVHDGMDVSGAAETIERCGAAPLLVQDMSGARAAFGVAGGGLRDVLSKLTPADMAPGAFAAGTVRRTRLGQVAAAIWMRDVNAAEVFCFRSVARYAYDALVEAARDDAQVGYF